VRRSQYRARVAAAADHCDVLVIGAGPAGSTTAQLLAAWGWSVVAVHRPAHTSSPSLAESFPPSIRKVLQLLGQLNDVEAAGFHSNDGNVARWANSSHVTKTPDNGFHVSRGAFDELLRRGARAGGARIVDGVVRRVDERDPIGVTYETGSGRTVTCHARYVVDCSGRAGVIARQGLRRVDAGYRTLAIAAEWDCGDWPMSERGQTLIESYRDGWAWSVPLSATRRQCTVMINPGERMALPAIYRRELTKAVTLGARLARARQISAPWPCDGSTYAASRAADGRTLLVGDAASFIEPLSSAGVKKALLSAWRAAVVVNTSLANSSMAGAALDLHVHRERHVYRDCLRRSRAFFEEAAAVYGTPFWSARAELVETSATGIDTVGDITDDDLSRDVDIRLAFDHLRASESIRLRPAQALRFEPVAAIEGREVVMREGVTMPGFPAPLHFAAGVSLPALARLASACDEVPTLIAAYQATIGPAPIGGLLTGLSLLIARRALVTEVQRP
jgi:flavin-dependent dehydrogenase